MLTEKAKKETHTAAEDLWRIAETGDTNDLESLLAAGVDLDASDSHGITALIRAVVHGRIEMVRLLLSHGADPNLRRNDRFTPLILAAFFGHEEIVRILVEHGADIYAGTRFGTTAQQWAAARTFQDVVHYLKTTSVDKKLSNKAVIQHSKSQAPKEASSPTVKSSVTTPVIAAVPVEESGDSPPVAAVETADELPNEQETFENIPPTGVVGSRAPLHPRRVVYAFATLLLAVGWFGELRSGNRQTPPPIIGGPVVITADAESLPEATPIPPSAAKVEKLSFTNDVNNSNKKPERVNNSTGAPATRRVVWTPHSDGSNTSEKRNGATSISQPPPSTDGPKDVLNADFPEAAVATATPKPAVSREPGPNRRPEPLTTQLLSPTKGAGKGRAIQWP